jgi:hypothetical protein
MPNYSNGKIYSIRFYDNDKLIYIGSTTQILAVRFGGHKRNICSLYQYIQEYYNGDFKCCYIELLEPYECNNRNELNRKEGEIIRKFKADDKYIVINKNISGRTIKEYNKDNIDKIKEKAKEYYYNNIQKAKEYYKEYREVNKEKAKEYREVNKDILTLKKKEYYKDNIEKAKEQSKEYYYNNIQKAKEYNKEYNRVNKDILTLKKKERRHAKKAQTQAQTQATTQ